MSALAKSVFETCLARSGLPRVARAVGGPRSLVLAYHNVVPEGGEPGADRSLHLPIQSFREQLELLAELANVVELPRVLDTEPGTGRRPRVAITFDDAYRGAVGPAVEELARHGMPGTIFVAPAFVGGWSFWWDSIRLDEDPGSVLGRAALLDECRGQDAAVRERAESLGRLEGGVPQHATAASEDELRAATGHSGISLGSHSWSHANLSRLDGAELVSELERPLRWLRERFEAVIPWISYPYGISSPAVRRAAAATGYRAGLCVTGGWLPRQVDDPFLLPRLNVPAGLSTRGLELRLSGLLAR